MLVGVLVAAAAGGTLGGQGWFDDLSPERITVQDLQNDGLAAVAELRVLQDNGEWVRRMLARDGDGGAMADSDTHDVDEGRRVRFRVCLQHGQGEFTFCGPWQGQA